MPMAYPRKHLDHLGFGSRTLCGIRHCCRNPTDSRLWRLLRVCRHWQGCELPVWQFHQLVCNSWGMYWEPTAKHRQRAGYVGGWYMPWASYLYQHYVGQVEKAINRVPWLSSVSELPAVCVCRRGLRCIGHGNPDVGKSRVFVLGKILMSSQGNV